MKTYLRKYFIFIFLFLFVSCATFSPINNEVSDTNYLLKQIMKVWPKLRPIYLTTLGNFMSIDQEYAVVSIAQAEEIIHWRESLIWIRPSSSPEIRDCDDFALKMMYEVRQNFRGNSVVPFGIAGGMFSIIGRVNHALNILVCSDGIILYDYQKDYWWIADPIQDIVYFWYL